MPRRFSILSLKQLVFRGIGILTVIAWLVGSVGAQEGSAKKKTAEKAKKKGGSMFARALENGEDANEGFRRCLHFVQGWLAHADPDTGLIPRNINRDKDIWNAKDRAADNYPFMVLTAALTDRSLFEGTMLDMLRTETKLTSRIGALPDTYSFSKKGFRDEKANLDSILFGSSEYIKDGLLPLTEWLGPSPWRDRMMAILDDMWERANVETPFGKIVSTNVEVNGEMLQTLSRIHWMTGEEKYLEWAIRLGDYYLLPDPATGEGRHPTRDMESLRLRDHGCEIVSGLCELYAAVHFARPEKKKAYRKPVHEMLDRILEVGRDETGLFYNGVNPKTGEITRKGIADTWGYTLNGYYTVFLLDGTKAYREATLKAMGCLEKHYKSYKWEGNSSDGYADSIESALNLYNREPLATTSRWLDSEIRVMWAMQQPDGVIEGWHGDGNFARTTIMYCLWKTQGLTIRPWREDVVFGAVRTNGVLKIAVKAKKEYEGRLLFDVPRHKTHMKMPMDWPRINQFPEWFTVEDNKEYVLTDATVGESKAYTGKDLREGITLNLKPGQEMRIVARPYSSIKNWQGLTPMEKPMRPSR